MREISEGPQPGSSVFLPTPWRGFNKGLGGWVRGVLSLIIMHSGDGKSSLLRSAVLAAAKEGHPCLFVSTEDPVPYTMDRFLAEMTGIATAGLSRLEATKEEIEQLHASTKLEALDRITVVSGLLDVPGTVSLVGSWLAALPEGRKAPLVAIDYLQNLVVGRNAEEELALVGQSLNHLAGLHGAAILGASQVRSESVNEAKRRLMGQKIPTQKPPNWIDFASYFYPTTSDAEYCRRLEKSAKFVMTGFRPGKWARNPPMQWDVSDDMMHLTIVKSNFTRGTGGTQRLTWHGETQTIRE